jgi:hypothetical protein
MVEGAPAELDLTPFYPEMTLQASVLSNCRSEVDPWHLEGERPGSHRLAYKLNRGTQQLVGVSDVVGAATHTDQLEVLPRGPQQAVGRPPGADRCRSPRGLGTTKNPPDLPKAAAHFLLPGREDIRVTHPVA